jgi:dTDP-4-amino-4,6-dideoxygalactose transaminase
MTKQVPFFCSDVQDAPFKDEIRNAIDQVLCNRVYVDGEETAKFEEEWGNEVGTKYCVFTSNGTSALEIALRSIQIWPEVITTPNSFFASSSAILAARHKISFYDTDETCNLDIKKVMGRLYGRYGAILTVDLYGNPIDHPALQEYCLKNKIWKIADQAQAHYTLYRPLSKFPVSPSRFSDISCYSFYSTKTLGCYGEAGCLCTNNEEIAEKARSLRNHGLTEKLYHHQYISGNLRGQEFQAAILRVKHGHKDYYIEERLKLSEQYTKNFSDYPEILLKVNPDCTRLVRYAYTIFHPQRNRLRQHLADQGISTNIHYPIPLHLQPAFSYLGYHPGDMPNAERQCNEVLSLPFYAGFKDVDYVSEKVLEFLKKVG